MGLATLAAAALTLQPLLATDAPAATTLAQQVGATPARAALPALPADGSGVYRLQLDQALRGRSPLVLWIEVRPGKAMQGVGLAVNDREVAWPADVSKLSLTDGVFRGEVSVAVIPRPSMHDERVHRKIAIADYKLEPVNEARFRLEVATDGRGGSGSYQATWSTRNLIDSQHAPKSGAVTVLRQALVTLPQRYEIDCEMSTALAELSSDPGLWIRAAMQGESATDLRVYAKAGRSVAGQPVSVIEPHITLREGELTGRFTGTLPFKEKQTFEVSFSGTCVGRTIHGQVTLRQDGKPVATTPWLGFLRDTAHRTPMDYPVDGWTWQHDLPPDEALATKAEQEALIPVLPGEPGKVAFGTWRSVCRGTAWNRTVPTIHPPGFDIEPTAGAVSYRYDLVGGRDPVKHVKTSFTSEVPWQTLAPVWKDLPPGIYCLTVVPLAADGTDLPGPMRLRVLSPESKLHGQRIDFSQPIPKAPWVSVDAQTIWITKKAPFAGPYFKPRWDYSQSALDIARWQCEPVGKLQNRGQNSAGWFAAGGEGSFGWDSAVYLWSVLGTRNLTTDPAERDQAEAMLAFLATEMELHQTKAGSPVFYAYKGMTPLSRWGAEAALDAFLQTGDERWRGIVLRYARALVKIQNEDGSFQSWTGRQQYTPVMNKWPEGHPAFSPSELLYCLGRIRRDLGTDEFLPAEQKALDYMRTVAVPERNFPCYVHHSHSPGYPIWQHPISALSFARYLLELAPAQDRDVKLAEDLARWSEDYKVQWDRAPEGPQVGQVRPCIPSGDRFNSSPIAGNVLAAIVFEQLARETGNKLWHAKAEALAAAISQAQDPASHYPNPELSTGKAGHNTYLANLGENKNFYMGMVGSWGWAVQLLREYAVLVGEPSVDTNKTMKGNP